MANIKQALGGTAVITCSLVNVANYASRESTSVINTTNLYLDAILSVKLQMTAAPIGDAWVLLGTGDATNYSNPATGTDAAVTIPQIDKLGGELMGQFHAGTNMAVLGKIACPATITTTGSVVAIFGSVAAALGGNLPPAWGPTIVNASGAALGATTANMLIWYDGVFATSV